MAYGFSRTFPFAYLVAVSTLIGFVLSRKERKPFPVSNITVVYLLFFFWMTFTNLFAINTFEVVLDRWIFIFKIHLMIWVTLMLIRGRKQIEHLVWVVTLSIGFYGIKGGLWTLHSGGGSGHVWGPADSMIEDNNGLGLAMVMLVPFIYYLYQVTPHRWIRRGLGLAGLLMCFSIFGSQSRGAFLALLAMAVLLTIKGKRKLLMGALLASVIAAAMLFMPSSWSDRMDTIQTYDTDVSAMSRFYSWQTLWNLAIDRPLVGGGFVTDNPVVFATYAPAWGIQMFGGKVWVAHSSYFQVLGDHGFPGLLLYLLFGIFTWRRASQLAQDTKDDPELGQWVPLLMRMVQVSMTGFAVGGAFLSLVHFDLCYYIVAYVILVDATLRERQKDQVVAGAGSPS
jgi:probable O-glycosylation ligase (exosortase A-associated)